MSYKKREESYHTKSVINKTGKLNFIKVLVPTFTGVTKSSLPDENSRARRKHRPKLLRESGKLQEILWIEIHRSLEECCICIGCVHWHWHVFEEIVSSPQTLHPLADP